MMKSLIPRFSDFVFILLFLSVLMSGPKMLNIDGDLPRHLLVGKVVLETGMPPTTEIFSYVYENRPYTPHEWLADVIFFLIYKGLGLNGIVLLAGILVAATFAILYSESVSKTSVRLLTLFLILVGAAVTSIHWITRPHLFTMLFLAVWMILTERLYRGIPVKIWVFALVMLLWANVHAEFIAGFLILFAYLAGSALQYLISRSVAALKTSRDLLTVALLSFLASLFNPVGLKTWDIVFGYVNNRYLLSRIAETRPPNFMHAEYWPLLALFAIAILVMIARRNEFAPAHFFLLAGFGVMSLLSARNAHLTGVVFPFVLSNGLVGIVLLKPLEKLEARIGEMEGQTRRSPLPAVVTILVSALVIAFPLNQMNRFEPHRFPVNAVGWLENHTPAGRMFNAFDWGGYILFYLWPEQKVFIESQTDVTGEVTQKYEQVVTLQAGWQDILERYDVNWAILPPEWPLARELKAQGWETVYQDQTAVIVVRE